MLELKKICAGYAGAAKLHGLNAKLERGKFIAVIGPNGSGKSTLMKCAAGLLKPMSGEILLEGTPLRAIPDKARARSIAYMPQSRIAPEISVRQLAAHGRYPHLKWGQNLRESDEAIIDAAIDRTRLKHCERQMVNKLSGGERQRAYLAMMLAQQTPILLLDEPTAYLDLSSQFALMKLLRELCREGRGVALVLHDIGLALEYADEILLLDRGALIAAGSPDAIYASGKIQSAFGVEIRQTEDHKYVFDAIKGERKA